MKKKKDSQRFFLKIVLPAIVTLAMFISAIFLILLPSFHKAMMLEKKESIKELSETAWSILNEYSELKKQGKLTEQEAKSKAISDINGLRYGNDMKDYFWISDMTPRMIVHPYRPELNGKDLSEFKDANNKKVFVEFVNVVEKNKEGYVEYYWQWKDNPGRIVPKLSYVKEFEPWKWIIGTGIYLEDVERQINQITHRMIVISFLIALFSFLLMFIVIFHSHNIEKERSYIELDLKESKEKYQALVESSSESFILILDKKFNYANNSALEIIGYSGEELLGLKITDIISPKKEQDQNKLKNLVEDQIEDTNFETVIYTKEKREINSLLSISRVSIQEKDGLIIILNEITPEKMNTRYERQRKIAEEQKKLIADLQNKKLFSEELVPAWETVSSSSNIQKIMDIRKGFPVKLASLIDAGMNVENLTAITSRMADAVALRFINIAIKELGHPPVPFSFIVFGSEGRFEQTLKTDQDNAIIFSDPDNKKDIEGARSYFLKLGTKVCDWMNDAGYTHCNGGNMAKNEQWVKSITEWKECFEGWIFHATPDNILRINIFFDFRSLYGEETLAENLWGFIDKTIQENPEFLMHFVNDFLLYKPPLTLFGKIALRGEGENKNTISLKEVITPIVQFARIYSLKHRINETNTLERLRELNSGNFMKESTYREVSEVYRLLMQLRFKHQATEMQEGNDPDNHINPKNLTDIEREILKKTFTAISHFQTKISYDFKGTA